MSSKLEQALKNIKPYYLKTFERHERDKADVASGKKPHLRFNKKIALAYVTILETFKHYKGEKAGEYFKLEDWQKKAVAIWAGWEKLNSSGEWVRRFDESFWFLPKKNGKTILASGLAVADSIIRGEIGGEVYSFATKRDQAKLAWEGFDKLIKMHDELSDYHKKRALTVTLTKNETIFVPIGGDSEGWDGVSATFAVADERHAHKNNLVYDNIESSMSSRKQPHIMSITTAGFNVAGPCFLDYEYAKKVLDGVIEDDSLFAFIAEAPQKPNEEGFEDWYFCEEVWKAANPNYGVSVSIDTFRKQAKDAKVKPNKLNSFLTKRLNVWVNAAESFFSLEDWNACKGIPERKGELVGGLDLSLWDDFSSFVEVWRYKGRYSLFPHFYLPKESIAERESVLKAPLVSWTQQGFITATPGKTINYFYIYKEIYELLDSMSALAYDAYKAKKLIKLIEEPLDADLILEFENDLDFTDLSQYSNTYDNCIPITQGFRALNEPTVMLKNLIKDRKIIHDGNPVLTWMLSNCSVVSNAQGNIMLNKTDRYKKIDGIAAAVNALAVLLATETKQTKSIYEDRGLREL